MIVVALFLQVSKIVAVASAVRLDLVAHSEGSLPGPGCSHPAAITSVVHLNLTVVVRVEFCSIPVMVTPVVCLYLAVLC